MQGATVVGDGTVKVPELSAPSRALFDAWRRWRGDSLVPARADMALHEVTALLPMLMIQEVRAPDQVIFRLAGTGISAALGGDLAGRNYLEMTSPEARLVRAERIQRLIGRPCGSIMETRFQTQAGLDFNVEIISLPLRPDDPAAPMQIVALAAPLGLPFAPQDIGDGPVAQLSDRYCFLDIGAGIPVDPAVE